MDVSPRPARSPSGALRRRGRRPGSRGAPGPRRLGGTGRDAGRRIAAHVPESQILGLIAAGYTNQEIAGQIHVSVPTVNRHVANIYLKIGARNRASATAYALRHQAGAAT